MISAALKWLGMSFWAVGTAIMAQPGYAEQRAVFQSSAGTLVAEVLADGLDHPWALAFLPDGRFLVTERAGRLRIVDADGNIGAPIGNVPPVATAGQGGLLDVVLDAKFSDNSMIYMSFSAVTAARSGPMTAGTAVLAARLVLEGSGGRLESPELIFQMNNFTSSGVHFGSRIVQAGDGNLFVTLGERGEMERAQDPFDLAGGVVRIGTDGSLPKDNPFADGKAGHAAFWSIGHRNPQGAALGPDGQLWTVEHGAKGGDEVNRQQAGKNYGWPHITYGENYNGRPIGIGTADAGYEQPVYYWDPSIAPSGMAFYAGEIFPGWEGDLLVGALKYQMLVHLKMDGDKVVSEERLFEKAFGRIRDVRVGPDGAIYLVTDEAKGQIVRVTPQK